MSTGRRPFIQKCKEVFLKADLFANPQLLKYRGEGAYQTYTGSIFSIGIVVFFFVAFYSMIKSTVNREKITAVPKLKPALDTIYQTNASNSAFMFAIGVEGFDLTAQQRYFDIFMQAKVYKDSKSFSSVDIALQPCTIDQWTSINTQFQNVFSRLKMNQWLCPPKGYNFTFKGKFTSEQFKYSKIAVRKCTSKYGGTCVNTTVFSNALASHKTFKLGAYFANPVIDPSQKNYLDYVIEDTSYFEFTDMVGVNSHMFFTEYEINTDSSILPDPITNIVTEKGLTLIERPIISNSEIINSDDYVKIHLRKADLIQQYDRSYTRLDVTFAYLGGLFGMVMILFYGMKVLSEYAYEYQIGNDLFVYKDDKEFESAKFNIFRFPVYLLYCIITFFYSKAEEWSCFQFYREVDQCREEVKEQSDVCFLLKRVIFIQKALQIFFNTRLNEIKITDKWTIEEARIKRQFYDQHQLIENMIRTSEQKRDRRKKTRLQHPNPANQLVVDNLEQPRFEGKAHHEIIILSPHNFQGEVDKQEIRIELKELPQGRNSNSRSNNSKNRKVKNASQVSQFNHIDSKPSSDQKRLKEQDKQNVSNNELLSLSQIPMENHLVKEQGSQRPNQRQKQNRGGQQKKGRQFIVLTKR